MVTEALPETEVENTALDLDTQATSANPESPVTETSQAGAERDDLASFLEAEGLTGGTQGDETQSQTTETVQNPDEKRYTEAEVRQRSAQIAAQQLQAKNEADVIMAFRQAAPSLRQWLNDLYDGKHQGITREQAINYVVNTLEGVNGYAKKIYSSDGVQAILQNHLNEAEKNFPGFRAEFTSDGKPKTTEEFIKALAEKSRKDYIPAKSAESIKKAAALEAVEKLTKNEPALRAALSRLSAPRNTEGQTAFSGDLTVDAASTLSPAQLLKMKAAGKF